VPFARDRAIGLVDSGDDEDGLGNCHFESFLRNEKRVRRISNPHQNIRISCVYYSYTRAFQIIESSNLN